jgi:hypothetical protein
MAVLALAVALSSAPALRVRVLDVFVRFNACDRQFAY